MVLLGRMVSLLWWKDLALMTCGQILQWDDLHGVERPVGVRSI